MRHVPHPVLEIVPNKALSLSLSHTHTHTCHMAHDTLHIVEYDILYHAYLRMKQCEMYHTSHFFSNFRFFLIWFLPPPTKKKTERGARTQFFLHRDVDVAGIAAAAARGTCRRRVP